MELKKICFVTREYAHPNMGKTGGIGVFLKQFTQQLQDQDFEITVFSFGWHGISFLDDQVKIIKIKDLSAFNEFVKAPLRRYDIPGYLTIKMMLEYLNRFYISLYLSVFAWRKKFDIIEFHDYGGDAPYFVAKLPKVVRCHGTALTLHKFMGYYNRTTDSVFERQFFKRINKHVIAVSKTSAQMTQQAFQLKNQPKVIYNGVQLPAVSLPKHYLDPPTVPFSVFYFGSVRERKGIDIACSAFNFIVERFPLATFHVLGNNNNDYWNRHAKLLLSNKAMEHTTYYGAVPNKDINHYLKKAHVVLFPSYGENFSVALLEVMAFGKLVVTSSIPAFQEIIKPSINGLMAVNLEDYIAHVSNIFSGNIDDNAMMTQAFETVQSQFNYDKIIKENINFYKSLL